MTTKELRAKRANLIKTARELTDKASTEKRELTSEENEQFDRAFDDAEKLKGDIERRERLEAAEKEVAELDSESRTNVGNDGENRATPAGDAENATAESAEQKAFRSWLIGGRASLTTEERSILEQRALSVGTAGEGGETVPPEQFIAQLIKAVDDATYVRQWGTGFQVASANGLGVPTLDSDPSDPTWTTELSTGTADAAMTFGKRNLSPNPLAKRLLISKQLIRQSGLNAEAIVIARLAYKYGVTWEKAAFTGTGSGQPLGVFTASADGIPVSRDVSAGNSATNVAMDGLINAKYALKQGYMANAKWVFHRDVVREIAKLRSDSGAGAGTGEYLWIESTRVGQPDTLLGIPAFMSEYAPNTLTTGLYAGILGDFSNYWYADSLAPTMQRLDELYAETNQTGFIARMESDGMPVLGEAFVRVQLA